MKMPCESHFQFCVQTTDASLSRNRSPENDYIVFLTKTFTMSEDFMLVIPSGSSFEEKQQRLGMLFQGQILLEEKNLKT